MFCYVKDIVIVSLTMSNYFTHTIARDFLKTYNYIAINNSASVVFSFLNILYAGVGSIADLCIGNDGANNDGSAKKIRKCGASS